MIGRRAGRKVWPPQTLRWFFENHPWARLDDPEIVRVLDEMLAEDRARLRSWVGRPASVWVHGEDPAAADAAVRVAARRWWLDRTGEVLPNG